MPRETTAIDAAAPDRINWFLLFLRRLIRQLSIA
jgi:hypothetical protein